MTIGMFSPFISLQKWKVLSLQITFIQALFFKRLFNFFFYIGPIDENSNFKVENCPLGNNCQIWFWHDLVQYKYPNHNIQTKLWVLFALNLSFFCKVPKISKNCIFPGLNFLNGNIKKNKNGLNRFPIIYCNPKQKMVTKNCELWVQ